MFTLRSSRLRVDIAEPNESLKRTLRFDRTGFITQVTLDEMYQFCTSEPTNLEHPSTGGVGLCSEIRSEAAVKAAVPGDSFHKFGVGLFKKPDDLPYIHYRKYEYEPYSIQYSFDDSFARFTTAPVLNNGFALKLEKTVAIHGNKLEVEYYAMNMGDKSIDLDEYCHNFVTIERLPIGPDYRIVMTDVAQQDGKKSGLICGSGKTFSFTGYADAASMLTIPGDEIGGNIPFSWNMTNVQSKASISEVVSFKPSCVSIWSIDHIVSPEVHYFAMINPGETRRWVRTWTFTD